MRSMDNKLLIISYAFPPDSSVGSLRPGSIAKYLPEFGWSPHTVTVHQDQVDKVDQDLKRSMERFGIVYRSRCFTNPLRYLAAIKKLVNRKSIVATVDISRPVEVSAGKNGSRLKSMLITLLTTPDEFLGWIPSAARTSLGVLRAQNIRFMLSSAPPYSCHLVALIVKVLRPHTQWLADFRDPMVSNEMLYTGKMPALAKTINGWFERMILRHADVVLCVNGAIAQDFKVRYHGRYDRKLKVLPNGFDAEEFDTVTPHKYQQGMIVISYFGNLYGNRDGRPLLSSLHDIFFDRPEFKERILLRFVGTRTPSVNTLLLREAARLGLDKVVEVVDHVSRNEAISLMKGSDILFLTQPDAPLQVPLKLYEYLACRKWILAITGDGATRDIIESTNSGIVVYPDDSEGLKKALLKSIDCQVCGGVEASRANINIFERRNTVKCLAEMMDVICASLS